MHPPNHPFNRSAMPNKHTASEPATNNTYNKEYSPVRALTAHHMEQA